MRLGGSLPQHLLAEVSIHPKGRLPLSPRPKDKRKERKDPCGRVSQVVIQ